MFYMDVIDKCAVAKSLPSRSGVGPVRMRALPLLTCGALPLAVRPCAC